MVLPSLGFMGLLCFFFFFLWLLALLLTAAGAAVGSGADAGTGSSDLSWIVLLGSGMPEVSIGGVTTFSLGTDESMVGVGKDSDAVVSLEAAAVIVVTAACAS